MKNEWANIKEVNDFIELIPKDISETFKDTYFQILKKFLPYNKLKDNQINVIIIPSFKPELLLKITKKKLALEAVSNNVFQYYHEEKLSEIKTIKKELKIIDNSINSFVLSIKENFKHAITFPSSSEMVLEGTMYFFIIKENGKEKIGFKHAPKENTKMGALIIKLNGIIKLFE